LESTVTDHTQNPNDPISNPLDPHGSEDHPHEADVVGPCSSTARLDQEPRTMLNTPVPPVPLIVRTGVMSQEEFDALSSTEQEEVERTTAEFCRQYGDGFLRRDRERHRDDLQADRLSVTALWRRRIGPMATLMVAAFQGGEIG
jgi:hypothetical protein